MHWWPLSVCLSVCLSVRLSVCPVPDPKSRMGGRSRVKIGRKEAHDTSDQWPVTSDSFRSTLKTFLFAEHWLHVAH